MSVNQEEPDTSSPKTKKNVEILEPGVSLVKPQRRYRRSVAILTRLFFAVLFLGLGIFAVYYSIVLSEKHQQDRENNDHHVDKNQFTLFHSQISTKGRLTIEQNFTGGARDYMKYDMIWLQDNSHSRLLFNVTEPESKKSDVYYVFQNHTLHVNSENKCEFLNIGYEDFIFLFGVVRLVRSGQDVIKMNDKYQNVEVYEGVPTFKPNNLNILLPGYDNGPPKLAFAYSFLNQGATCGWQIYFDSHEKQDANHIEWVEYWFTDMEEKEPSAEQFVDYTGDCVERKPVSTTTNSSPTQP